VFGVRCTPFATGCGMARSHEAKAERLRAQSEDVQKALEQTTPGEAEPPRKTRKKDLFWLTVHGVLAVAFGVLAYLIANGDILVPGTRFGILARVPTALAIIAAALAIERAIEGFAIQRLESPVSRYNLTRIIRLIAGIAILAALGAYLLGNFYTGLVSLGVISIVVGLAVQTPMTSFIGWLYILVRQPYRVGDRIQIDDATGDVIEVGYLDTTLWEFGGKYLSSDHPSGRIIKFPNSKVLNTLIYNYSWPLFPYIWNEIKFNIAYESDIEFVGKVLKELTEETLGKEMLERVRVFRELLAKTPVDELQVREHPAVLFRFNENTWLDAIVRYLVHPKTAGRVKTDLTKKILARLSETPDRVLFPKSNAR
jgi:small-conductance mechanosensitive channel